MRFFWIFFSIIFVGTSIIGMQQKQPPIPESELEFAYGPVNELPDPENPIEWQQISLMHGDNELGFITYGPQIENPTIWEINEVIVHSNHRQKGYATMLFEACFQEMIEARAAQVTWESKPLTNQISYCSLVAMYEKLIETKIKPLKNGTLKKFPGNGRITVMVYTFDTTGR